MRIVVKIVKWLLGLIVLAIAALFAWLYIAPPELIRVGSGYSAKIVCSNVFIAGRDPNEVLAVDVQAPGHPLLRLMRVSVDKNRGTVSAGLLGFFGKSVAVARDGLGCASVPDGDVGKARRTDNPCRAVGVQPGRAVAGRRAGRGLAGPGHCQDARRCGADRHRACARWWWSRTAASSPSAMATAFRRRRRCSAGR